LPISISNIPSFVSNIESKNHPLLYEAYLVQQNFQKIKENLNFYKKNKKIQRQNLVGCSQSKICYQAQNLALQIVI